MKLSWIEKQIMPPYSQKASNITMRHLHVSKLLVNRISKVEGTFTSKNAGGNCTYPSFMINPQYRLIVHSTGPNFGKVNVTLTLRCGKDLPVNVAMVWAEGQRLSE